MNLAQLQEKIGDWLQVNTERLPNTVRTDLLNMAQRELLEGNALHFGEATGSFDTVVGQEGYALPDDFILPGRLLYVGANRVREIDFVSRDQFLNGYFGATGTGFPRHFTTFEGEWKIGPLPDAVYTVTFDYRAHLADLSDANPSNAFTTEAWEVLLYKALILSSDYTIEDPRTGLWEKRYQAAYDRLLVREGRRKSGNRRGQSQEQG